MVTPSATSPSSSRISASALPSGAVRRASTLELNSYTQTRVEGFFVPTWDGAYHFPSKPRSVSSDEPMLVEDIEGEFDGEDSEVMAPRGSSLMWEALGAGATGRRIRLPATRCSCTSIFSGDSESTSTT